MQIFPRPKLPARQRHCERPCPSDIYKFHSAHRLFIKEYCTLRTWGVFSAPLAKQKQIPQIAAANAAKRETFPYRARGAVYAVCALPVCTAYIVPQAGENCQAINSETDCPKGGLSFTRFKKGITPFEPSSTGTPLPKASRPGYKPGYPANFTQDAAGKASSAVFSPRAPVALFRANTAMVPETWLAAAKNWPSGLM